MDSNTYTATANSINSALKTAGIETLTFTKVSNLVLDKTYPNALDCLGYILDSDLLKVNKIITAELNKYGNWSVLKSTSRAVTTPAAPTGDHYIVYSTYYINSADLPADEVAFVNFKTDVETATKSLSSTIQNKAKSISWKTASESSTVVIQDDVPSAGKKTVTSTVTIVLEK